MYIKIINKERGHGFEEKNKSMYGTVWREESIGRNGVIIISN